LPASENLDKSGKYLRVGKARTRPSAGLSVSIAHRGLIEEQQRVLAWSVGRSDNLAAKRRD
jgi:hypothetical protein